MGGADLRMTTRMTMALVILTAVSVYPLACSAGAYEDLDQRIGTCNLVLKNILDMPDRGIPKDLLRRCRGLAIFPGVIKVGAVLSLTGQYAEYGTAIKRGMDLAIDKINQEQFN